MALMTTPAAETLPGLSWKHRWLIWRQVIHMTLFAFMAATSHCGLGDSSLAGQTASERCGKQYKHHWTSAISEALCTVHSNHAMNHHQTNILLLHNAVFVGSTVPVKIDNVRDC